MANTGYKIYEDLIEVYVDNGQPTGNTMENDPSSEFYIPPVLDEETCPTEFLLKIVTDDYLNNSQIKIENVNDTYTLIRSSSEAGEDSISINDGYYLATVTVPRNRAKTIKIGSDVRTNTGPYTGGNWIEYFNNVSGNITAEITVQDLVYEGDDSSGGYFCEQDGTTTTSTSSTTTTTTTRSNQQAIYVNNNFVGLPDGVVDFTVIQNGVNLTNFTNNSTTVEQIFTLDNFNDDLTVFVENNHTETIFIYVPSINEYYELIPAQNVYLFNFPNYNPIILDIMSEQIIIYNYYYGAQPEDYVINEFENVPYAKDGNKVTVLFTNDGGKYLYFIHLKSLGNVVSITDNFGSETISDWSYIEEINIGDNAYRVMRMNYITGIFTDLPMDFIFG